MYLKKLRENSNMTQVEVAEKLNVSRSTIAMIENGTNNPSVPLAKRLGELFGVDWKNFFEC